MNYTKIITSISILGLFIVGLPSVGNAAKYLPEYDEYRGIGPAIIESAYTNYKNVKLQTEKVDGFTTGEEGSGSVQVKTIFDFYSDKRSERIESVRATLLQKIKNNEPAKIGNDAIDTIIDKIQTPGKYIVIRADGDIIPIDEDLVIYLFDYKITGKEELINVIKNRVSKLQSNEKQTVESRNTELANIIKTLDEYKIKYVRIGKSIEGNVFIGKGNGLKVEGKENFFISKIFTTPELKEKVEANATGSIYFWTYIDNATLKNKYYSENNGLNNDIFVKLLGDTIYAGTIANGTSQIYQSTLYPSRQDIFIYSIQKSAYEYVILGIMFILGTLLGLYLTANFVNNFRNNFKKTPEEL